MKKLFISMFLVFCAQALADSSVGCGLGSLIWKDNSIVSALVRGTTNQSFSSQLFGITTGTSGCSKHSIVQVEHAPVYYAEANLDQLKVQAAQGEGEYLQGFAQTFGCSEDTYASFGQSMNQNYGELFVNAPSAPREFVNQVKSIMVKQSQFTSNCQYLN